MIDESGLTFAQMKVLVALDDAGNAPEGPSRGTVTALSESLGFSPASASRAADGLVKKGLATRVEDPEDRRVRLLALTPDGSELADRIVSARLAGLEEFTSSLTPDESGRLEAALDALLERDEIADVYRRYQGRVRR
jgi:DNA-binding MarR family transcriptional regulator